MVISAGNFFFKATPHSDGEAGLGIVNHTIEIIVISTRFCLKWDGMVVHVLVVIDEGRQHRIFYTKNVNGRYSIN